VQSPLFWSAKKLGSQACAAFAADVATANATSSTMADAAMLQAACEGLEEMPVIQVLPALVAA